MGQGLPPSQITRSVPPWMDPTPIPFVASCRPPRVPLKPIPDPAPAGYLAALIAAIKERLPC